MHPSRLSMLTPFGGGFVPIFLLLSIMVMFAPLQQVLSAHGGSKYKIPDEQLAAEHERIRDAQLASGHAMVKGSEGSIAQLHAENTAELLHLIKIAGQLAETDGQQQITPIEQEANNERVAAQIRKLMAELEAEGKPKIQFDLTLPEMSEGTKESESHGEKKQLFVRLTAATNLPPMDNSGLSDPYVVLCLKRREEFPKAADESRKSRCEKEKIPSNKTKRNGRNKTVIEYKHKTRIYKETLEPIFTDPEFIFELDCLHCADSGKVLVLDIWDWNRITGDDFIGSVKIDLGELLRQNIVDRRTMRVQDHWADIQLSKEANTMENHWRVKVNIQQKIHEKLTNLNWDNAQRYNAALKFCNDDFDMFSHIHNDKVEQKEPKVKKVKEQQKVKQTVHGHGEPVNGEQTGTAEITDEPETSAGKQKENWKNWEQNTDSARTSNGEGRPVIENVLELFEMFEETGKKIGSNGGPNPNEPAEENIVVIDEAELEQKRAQLEQRAEAAIAQAWLAYDMCLDRLLFGKALAKLQMSTSFTAMLRALITPEPIYLAKQLAEAKASANHGRFLHILLEIVGTQKPEELKQLLTFAKFLFNGQTAWKWKRGEADVVAAHNVNLHELLMELQRDIAGTGELHSLIAKVVGGVKDKKVRGKTEQIVLFLRWRLFNDNGAKSELQEIELQLRNEYLSEVKERYVKEKVFPRVEFTLEYKADAQELHIAQLAAYAATATADMQGTNPAPPIPSPHHRVRVELHDHDVANDNGPATIFLKMSTAVFGSGSIELEQNLLAKKKLVFHIEDIATGKRVGRTELLLRDLVNDSKLNVSVKKAKEKKSWLQRITEMGSRVKLASSSSSKKKKNNLAEEEEKKNGDGTEDEMKSYDDDKGKENKTRKKRDVVEKEEKNDDDLKKKKEEEEKKAEEEKKKAEEERKKRKERMKKREEEKELKKEEKEKKKMVKEEEEAKKRRAAEEREERVMHSMMMMMNAAPLEVAIEYDEHHFVEEDEADFEEKEGNLGKEKKLKMNKKEKNQKKKNAQQMADSPSVLFRFDYSGGQLTVNVLRAKNLQLGQLGAKNPKVKMYLLPETLMLADTGEPQFTSINPEFNFRHKLLIPSDELQKKYLLFSIRGFHFLRKHRTRVGDIIIPLADMEQQNGKMLWKCVDLFVEKESSFKIMNWSTWPKVVTNKAGNRINIGNKQQAAANEVKLLDAMLAKRKSDQILVRNVYFDAFRGMPNNVDRQLKFFQKTLFAAVRPQANWRQYYAQRVLVPDSEWAQMEMHRQDMERILVTRLGKDLDSLAIGKMEKIYKMIEWLKPERVPLGEKVSDYVTTVFQGKFRKAHQNAKVPEARPYRQAIRRMLRLENRHLSGYDDFMNDYGFFLTEYMERLGHNAFDFKFYTKNLQFMMRIELDEKQQQLGLDGAEEEQGKNKEDGTAEDDATSYSNSVFLHNLFKEVNAELISRLEQMFADEYANLNKKRINEITGEKQKLIFGERLRKGVRHVKGRVENIKKDMNPLEVREHRVGKQGHGTSVVKGDEEDAKNGEGNEENVKEEDAKVEEIREEEIKEEQAKREEKEAEEEEEDNATIVVETMPLRDDMLAKFKRAFELLALVHSNALGYVLQCVARPSRGLARRRSNVDTKKRNNGATIGTPKAANVKDKEENKSTGKNSISKNDKKKKQQPVKRTKSEGAKADEKEEEEEEEEKKEDKKNEDEIHEIEDEEEEEENYGENEEQHSADIEKENLLDDLIQAKGEAEPIIFGFERPESAKFMLHCPPVGIDVPADALGNEQQWEQLRELRDHQLVANIERALDELLALHVVFDKEVQGEEEGKTVKHDYHLGRVVLRNLGYSMKGNNGKWSVGQKIVDQLGAMVEKRHYRMMLTMNSDWDVKYAFNMMDFVGSTELNMWGKDANEMDAFEWIIQGIFSGLLNGVVWLHKKAIMKRNFVARFLVQHVFYFQMQSFRDLVSGKQDPVQFLALTFFTKFYLAFKGILWFSKELFHVLVKWDHYLLDEGGWADCKRDLYRMGMAVKRKWTATWEEKIGIGFGDGVWKDSDYRVDDVQLKRQKSEARQKALSQLASDPNHDENFEGPEEEKAYMAEAHEAVSKSLPFIKQMAKNGNYGGTETGGGSGTSGHSGDGGDGALFRKKRQAADIEPHRSMPSKFSVEVVKSLVMLGTAALMYYATYPLVLWFYYSVIDVDCTKDGWGKVLAKALASPFVHLIKYGGHKARAAVVWLSTKVKEKYEELNDNHEEMKEKRAEAKLKKKMEKRKKRMIFDGKRQHANAAEEEAGDELAAEQQEKLNTRVRTKCGLIIGRAIKLLHVMTTLALVVLVFIFFPLN